MLAMLVVMCGMEESGGFNTTWTSMAKLPATTITITTTIAIIIIIIIMIMIMIIIIIIIKYIHHYSRSP